MGAISPFPQKSDVGSIHDEVSAVSALNTIHCSNTGVRQEGHPACRNCSNIIITSETERIQSS